MRLRSKLSIGFGAILILMIIVIYFSIYMLHDQNEKISELAVTRYEKIRLSTTVYSEVNKTAKSIRNILLDPAKLTDQEIQSIKESNLKSDQAIEELLHTEDMDQGKEMLLNLQSQITVYQQDVDEVLSLLKAGKKEEANQLFLTEDQAQVRSDIEEKITDLQNLEHTQMMNLLAQSTQSYDFTIRLLILIFAIALVTGIIVSQWVVVGISRNIKSVLSVINEAQNQKKGHLSRIKNVSKDEIGQIASAYNLLVESIELHTQQEEQYKKTLQHQALLETNVSKVVALFQEVHDLASLADLLLQKVCPIIHAQFGVLYIRKGESGENGENTSDQYFTPLASFAYPFDFIKDKHIHLGEGLIGQCAKDHQKIFLKDIPDEYYKIHSGLGEALPRYIIILPIEFEGEVTSILEFSCFSELTPFENDLLERIIRVLGITLNSIEGQMRVKSLLVQSQTLTEELQVHSEELQLQHEELRSTNEQLEKQYRESEQKTEELKKVSQFKSEFLANMSHELRTPLNSLLILAQTFSENKEGNLTSKQIEYALTIYSAGKDLLDLINDILDLSKVESGKMNILLSEVNLQELTKGIEDQFFPLTREKGLSFKINISSEIPDAIVTDQKHLLQIIKNLLANAIKFTEKGRVQLDFYKPSIEILHREGFKQSSVLAISIKDTGTGIAKEKFELIFEAFRQGDGTMSRKYGGTGLGLSISRELAKLLGGTITVESEEKKGSTFTLYLPYQELKSETLENNKIAIDSTPAIIEAPAKNEDALPCPASLKGKTILIVDDDMRNIFALTSLLETHQMNTFYAESGKEAITVLNVHSKIDLVLMDIMMPDMDGYETMRNIRHMEGYQTLPIIAVTAKVMKNDRQKCLEAGASDYIQKPVIPEQLLSLMRVWLYKGGKEN